MDRFRTRGQAAAVTAVARMVRTSPPHAVLVAGPEGVGKTTLALDLTAGLLCTAEPGDRPCRACRACRLVEHGTHPDVHRLGPTGPGRQVVIGGGGARGRGVRDLISELALLPVEGGFRIAIIDAAERMNDDAQAALLKTLEEPPDRTVIILTADGDARLLPTVRSRCARMRLGLVGPRDIEAIMADQGVADPPTAARLGRLAGGRPGLALAYARAPEALLIRAELARTLLDLTDARASARLAAARVAIARSMAMGAALDRAVTRAEEGGAPGAGSTAGRGRKRAGSGPAKIAATSASPTSIADPATLDGGGSSDQDPAEPGGSAEAAADELDGPARAVPATDRRRAAERLIAIWSDVARDLILAGADGTRSVHDIVLIDELSALAPALPPGSVEAFLARASRAADLLTSNVSPESLIDSLVLAWPARRAAA